MSAYAKRGRPPLALGTAGKVSVRPRGSGFIAETRFRDWDSKTVVLTACGVTAEAAEASLRCKIDTRVKALLGDDASRPRDTPGGKGILVPTAAIPDIRPVDRERFLQKTRRESNGCLLWTASVNGRGYGTAAVNGHIYLAHRVAWEMQYGAIPDGFTIDHAVCSTLRCVEVTHLEVVTHRANSWRQAGFKWSECYQTALLNLAANPRVEYTRSEAGLITGLSLPSIRRAVHQGEIRENGNGRFDRRISRKELGRFIIARALEDAGLPVMQGYVRHLETLVTQRENAA